MHELRILSSRRLRADAHRPQRLMTELRHLTRKSRPDTPLVELQRMPRLCRSSWALEDLRLRFSDGSVLHLVWKDLDREGPGSRTRFVKPTRVSDPRREPWIYETLLPSVEGPPTCLRTVSDDAEGIHWLFLEPIEGRPLCEVGERRIWKAAAGWLGRFHARPGDAKAGSPLLLHHDVDLHLWWFRRAVRLSGSRSTMDRGAPDGRSPGNRRTRLRRRLRLLRALEPLHRLALDRIFEEGPCLLHGEFYPANVLAGGTSRRPVIVPVDWEMAGIGPPALDLAALTSGGWSRDDESELVEEYRRARIDAGGPYVPLDRLLGLVDAARLVLAVQWLGWAGDEWRQPEELRNDWLEEAVRSARRLSA